MKRVRKPFSHRPFAGSVPEKLVWSPKSFVSCLVWGWCDGRVLLEVARWIC